MKLQDARSSNGTSAAATSLLDDLDVIAYLDCRRQRIPRRKIAEFLGWPSAKVSRIRSRVERYRAKHPLKREQAFSGTQVTGDFHALWYPQVRETCAHGSNSALTIEAMAQDLSAQLISANRRMSELLIEEASLSKVARDLEAASVRAEAAATVERETAFIESRPENEGVIRAALVAGKKLTEATAKHSIAVGAILRQRDVISGIRAEIEAQACQKLTAAIEPKATELARLQDRMNAVYGEILAECASAGQQLFASHLFPGDSQSVAELRLKALITSFQVARLQGFAVHQAA